MKIDLGSGRAHFKDYKTIDNDDAVGADYRIDILRLPFENNSIEEVRAHHILEHIETKNKVRIMAEIYRVLRRGGILDIEVPLFPHPASIQDPTHLSFWCKESFWYFIKGNKFGEAFAKRYSQCKVPLFEFVSDYQRGDWAYGIKLKK